MEVQWLITELGVATQPTWQSPNYRVWRPDTVTLLAVMGLQARLHRYCDIDHPNHLQLDLLVNRPHLRPHSLSKPDSALSGRLLTSTPTPLRP